MNRRLTVDSLPKKVPVRINFESSVTKREPEYVAAHKGRQGSPIHLGYIDDQALADTRFLPPDTTGCPRFRFYTPREPGSKTQVHRNVLINSYYPTIECDYSEDHESQKSNFHSPNSKESGKLKSVKSASKITAFIAKNQQRIMKKPSIDSRTFTIYSCKSDCNPVHDCDNPQPEGELDLEKNCETLSASTCFSQLRKRIEKLEEKLQQTLEKSKKMNKTAQKKSKSVQKLFHLVSGTFDKSEKSKVKQLPQLDNSDTENEIHNIKKRLSDLERKLKNEEKFKPRYYLQSTTTSRLLFKMSVGEFSESSKIILKESDYTEPLHSDTDYYLPKQNLSKNKKKMNEETTNQKGKKSLITNCKVRKRNSNKKISKPAVEFKGIQKESCDKEVSTLTDAFHAGDVGPQRNKNLDCKSKSKFRKKRQKNRKLCKKGSKTNILTEETQCIKDTPKKQESVNSWTIHQSQKCWVPCACAECPYKALPAAFVNSSSPSYADSKIGDAELQKPFDFFKRGTHSKIPVLFEEVLTDPRPSCNKKETSKVSMKFILKKGNTDPLARLKKLVKKTVSGPYFGHEGRIISHN